MKSLPELVAINAAKCSYGLGLCTEAEPCVYHQRDAAVAEAAGLKVALRMWGEHESGCDPRRPGGCRCGFTAALSSPGPGAALLERHASEVAALRLALGAMASFCPVQAWAAGPARVLADVPAAGRVVAERLRAGEKLIDAVSERCRQAVPEWAPELRAALAEAQKAAEGKR
jgi:hypothetical protein